MNFYWKSGVEIVSQNLEKNYNWEEINFSILSFLRSD